MLENIAITSGALLNMIMLSIYLSTKQTTVMQEFPLVLTPLYQPYQIWTSTSMGIDSCDNLHTNIIGVTHQRQFAKFPLDQHFCN